MSIEAVLREHLSDTGGQRMSGQGEFIHETFQKVVALEDYASGVEFQSEEHRKAFTRLVRFNTGLEFGTPQEVQRRTYEKFYFDQGKVRKDVVDLPADVRPDAIQQVPESRPSIYAYDGGKTVAISPGLEPGGEQMDLVSIRPNRISVPQFQSFGLNDSGKDAAIFLNALDNGTASVKGYVKEGRIHATYILGGVLNMRGEFVFSQQGHRLIRSQTFVGDVLTTETLCGEYVCSDSGQWYPSTYEIRKYAVIEGQRVLAWSDSYKVIKSTVDFNVPIAPEVFDPQLPAGAHVVDYRHSRPREFVVQLDSKWLEVDWNKFGQEKPASLDGADAEHAVKRNAAIAADTAHGRAPIHSRTWLQEWGYLAGGLVLVFGFMFWLAWRKRRKARAN